MCVYTVVFRVDASQGLQCTMHGLKVSQTHSICNIQYSSSHGQN